MMWFSIAPAFITFVAFIIIVSVIRGFMRHNSLFDRVTDEIERAARERRDVSAAPIAREQTSRDSGDYACNNCGAGLDVDNEISPSGDFKCHYCNTWNNVNQ